MGKLSRWLGVWMLAAMAAVCVAAEEPAAPAKGDALKSDKEKVSYAIGAAFGKDIKRAELDVDMDVLIQGMRDAAAGNAPLLSEEETQKALATLQRDMAQKHGQRMKEMGEKNKKQGDDFLAENKKKEGIVTLPDGLQYKVLKEGDGKFPAATDTVSVHYRGTLPDGVEFDSSYRRGAPASIPVMGVIRGWTEALQKMKVGSKWMLYIPSDLAYGERGSGATIGPNQTLIFEVELLGIQEAPKEAQEAQ